MVSVALLPVLLVLTIAPPPMPSGLVTLLPLSSQACSVRFHEPGPVLR